MPAKKILSELQWKILLDYMEANPMFAKGIASKSGPESKQKTNTRWKRLARRLNNVRAGGCTKNYIQWRDYWNNTKYMARKKVITIQKQIKGNLQAEGLKRFLLLTKNEKRVLTSLGIPIPIQIRMKIKSHPVSPLQNLSTPPQPDVLSPESVILDIPSKIKEEPHSSSSTSPVFNIPSSSKPLGVLTAEQTSSHTAAEWVQNIEERRLAVEERSSRALQGLQVNTEICASALRGIQCAQESLGQTLQNIQVALEESARIRQWKI